MTPHEIFASLARGSPREDQAWSELQALLRTEAARVLSRLDEADREDYAQEVALSVLLLRDRGALPELVSDVKVRSYLVRALRNQLLDDVRRPVKMESMDSPRTDDEGAPPPREAVAPQRFEGGEVEDMGKLFARLEEVFEHALALEPDADVETRRAGWLQIQLLVSTPADTRAVLEQTNWIGPACTTAETARAHNRMYKVHQRVRASLLLAIDDLQARGRLDGEQAAELRRATALLRRRQKLPLPRVHGMNGNRP